MSLNCAFYKFSLFTDKKDERFRKSVIIKTIMHLERISRSPEPLIFHKCYFRYVPRIFFGSLQERLRGQYCVRNGNGEPIFGSFERNNGNGNGAPNWAGPNVRNLVEIKIKN